MPPRRGDAQVVPHRAVRQAQVKDRAVRRRTDTGNKEICRLVGQRDRTERDVLPDVRRPCPEQRLVPVKEKLSARAHSVQHLQLGAGDVFPRAEGFKMRRADIGNDCDIRTRRTRQGGYLAARAHAHFQHCRAHVGSDARHAKAASR